MVTEELTQTVDCICTLSMENFAVLIRLLNIFVLPERILELRLYGIYLDSNSSEFQDSIKRRLLTVCQLNSDLTIYWIFIYYHLKRNERSGKCFL
jgi:hypothetical protein